MGMDYAERVSAYQYSEGLIEAQRAGYLKALTDTQPILDALIAALEGCMAVMNEDELTDHDVECAVSWSAADDDIVVCDCWQGRRTNASYAAWAALDLVEKGRTP